VAIFVQQKSFFRKLAVAIFCKTKKVSGEAAETIKKV